MIKNIPNKYDQQMLISEIDERHAGLYDFFYLPIDPKVSESPLILRAEQVQLRVRVHQLCAPDRYPVVLRRVRQLQVAQVQQ